MPATTPNALTFDLPLAGHCVSADMREISGAVNTVATRCTLERLAQGIRLTIDAEDHDMLNLIATAPVGNENDQFLYEEDCVQIALALPGCATPDHWLMVNPLGKCKATGEGKRWRTATSRHGRGWSVLIDIPAPPGLPHVGLSVHRFYRGVHHEVQGLTPHLPHPLNPTEFAVVALDGDPTRAADEFRQCAAAAIESQLNTTLTSARQRIAAHAHGPIQPTLATALELLHERLQRPIEPREGFQCWNEAYLHHALTDLWELSGERAWIDIAIERMERTWATRADRLGRVDRLWACVLPSWINDSETGAVCTLVTGVILYPIARLIELVHGDSRLADMQNRVAPWIALCEESIDLHDREWIDFPDGSGMHVEPFNKGPRRMYPRGGSRINPLNRGFLLALPMLHLASVTGHVEYRRKVRAMARYFRQACQTTREGGLVWEYLTSRYPAEGEDISHAGAQYLFAEACAQRGIVFTEEDLRAMSMTLDKHVFRHGDVPCDSLRGFYPGIHIAAGLWSPLCRYAPHVFPRIEAVLRSALNEARFDFRREGWGIRLLTQMERARRMLATAAKPQAAQS